MVCQRSLDDLAWSSLSFSKIQFFLSLRAERSILFRRDLRPPRGAEGRDCIRANVSIDKYGFLPIWDVGGNTVSVALEILLKMRTASKLISSFLVEGGNGRGENERRIRQRRETA